MVGGLPPEPSLSQPQSGVEPRAVQSGEWALRAVIGHESVVNGPARWNIEACSDRELDGFFEVLLRK